MKQNNNENDGFALFFDKAQEAIAINIAERRVTPSKDKWKPSEHE